MIFTPRLDVFISVKCWKNNLKRRFVSPGFSTFRAFLLLPPTPHVSRNFLFFFWKWKKEIEFSDVIFSGFFHLSECGRDEKLFNENLRMMSFHLTSHSWHEWEGETLCTFSFRSLNQFFFAYSTYLLPYSPTWHMKAAKKCVQNSGSSDYAQVFAQF